MRKVTVTFDEDGYDGGWRSLVNELASRLGTVAHDAEDGTWELDQARILTAIIKAAENERDIYAIAASNARTWDEIGAAVGTSRQAAHKRFSPRC